MPLNTTTAAAASSSFTSATRKKGRWRNEYSDGESEEEATLLGEGERDPGFLHDDEEEEGSRPAVIERVHEAAPQVRVRVLAIPCPLLLTWRVCASSDRRCGEGQRTDLGSLKKARHTVNKSTVSTAHDMPDYKVSCLCRMGIIINASGHRRP